ncbi:MAG: hypothetical protein H0X62_12755 [Bacteroidetes bacterium]|nr:hypothetical protein [Bacteroidota bacterium]
METLKEFDVFKKKNKYRNRDNKAVDLIRLVIENRELNSIARYDYCSLKRYGKSGHLSKQGVRENEK